MTFPTAAQLAGNNFDNIDGNGYLHHEWMGDVGDVLNGIVVFPNYFGSGSPEGVVTADGGQWYLDTDNGQLWAKGGIDGTDTDWVGGFGVVGSGFGIEAAFTANGLILNPSSTIEANSPTVIANVMQSVKLTDAGAEAGSGNGLIWNPDGGADEAQRVGLFLGPGGSYEWHWNADGSTEFPGALQRGTGPSFAGVVEYTNSVLYLARTAGAAGNALTVELENAGASQSLAVTEVGNAVTVTLATDGGSVVT